MTFNKNKLNIKRIRKLSPDPRKGLRLNRAEFGHDFIKKKKKEFSNYYYPEARPLINRIAKLHKVKEENINIGLGGESLIKDIYVWHSRKFREKKVGFGLPNFGMYVLNAKIYGYKIANYLHNPIFNHFINVNYIKNFLIKKKNKLFYFGKSISPY